MGDAGSIRLGRLAIAGILARLIGAVFLLAAVIKAWSPKDFWTALSYLVPAVAGSKAWLIVLSGVIVLVETLVGMSLVLFGAIRRLIAAAFVLLLGFSGVLVLFAFDEGAPGCGCLGTVQVFDDAQQASQIGLMRNGAMLWMLAWMWRISKPQGDEECQGVGLLPATADIDSPKVTPSTAIRGFTILELLAVVAIISVLLALSFPFLRKAKLGAEEVRSLSDQRQLVAAITMYTKDYNGFFPYLTEAGNPFPRLQLRGWEASWTTVYFKPDSKRWASLVVPTYCDAIPDKMRVEADDPNTIYERIEGAGGRNPVPFVSCSYVLTHTTSARPEFWAEDEAPNDLSLLAGTRIAEVKFTSQKGLLLDVSTGFFLDGAGEDQERISVGRMDGSAAYEPWNGQINRARSVERVGLGAIAWPIMTTRHGIRGRDF